MSIELYCQHCGQHLKIPDQFAGQIGACKKCGKKIRVPVPGFEPELSSAPARRMKDIPYTWIGATAAIVIVLALIAYALLGRDSAAPTQALTSTSTSPPASAPSTQPQNPPAPNIAENRSPPIPDFPNFTPGKNYISLATDTQSTFTVNRGDITFDIGERREFIAGIGNIRERPGYSFSFDTVNAFDFQGETFHTLRFTIMGRPSVDFPTIMRNDGLYFYHFADDEGPRFFIQFPLKAGMRWSHGVYRTGDGRGTPERQIVTQHYYADAEETIQIPAGTFRCVRVLMADTPPQHDASNVYANWYAKGFGGLVQVRLEDGFVHQMKLATKP